MRVPRDVVPGRRGQAGGLLQLQLRRAIAAPLSLMVITCYSVGQPRLTARRRYFRQCLIATISQRLSCSAVAALGESSDSMPYAS